MLAAVVHRFRQRLRDYWWLWLLIVIAAVALNEVFDRDVAGDQVGIRLEMSWLRLSSW